MHVQQSCSLSRFHPAEFHGMPTAPQALLYGHWSMRSAQQFDRVAHALLAAGFAGMHGAAQARRAGAPERLGKARPVRPAAASLPSIERATTRGCRRATSASTSSAAAAVPRRPVRRVDDHVGIAGAAVGHAPAVAVAQRGQARRRCSALGPSSAWAYTRAGLAPALTQC